MARSKKQGTVAVQAPARRDRFRNGRAWLFNYEVRGGSKREHWSTGGGAADDDQLVELYPPDIGNPYWLVAVDGVEVLDLPARETRAERLAFQVAEAFARQTDPFTQVLRQQGYEKRPGKRSKPHR